jgi:hypothetical protein
MTLRLVIDVPNIFWRTISAQSGKWSGTTEENSALALHSCLISIRKWFNKVNPDQIIVVFEGQKNWRKTYTASEEAIAKTPYKGNRVKDPSMDHLYLTLNDFEAMARDHTSIICLSAPEVEGDDLISGCARRFSKEGDKVVILSGDKDFIQLLKYPGVTLLNPDKGELRTHEDPEYFMFEKAFRGDSGDNVRSAFPRVRATRLQKAYNDPYELTLIMNEEWSVTDPETLEVTTYRVKDLFEENQLLMNLERQPDHIKAIIDSTIDHGLNNHGKFNLFAFSKFLGKHELNNIAADIDKFIKVFNCQPVKKSSILKF